MSHAKGTGGAGPSHRGVEIGFAIFMGLLGALSVIGSLSVGIGWGASGPRAGFFPFYVGAIVVIGSLINLYHALREPGGKVFAEWSQIRQVISVVIPTAIYVLAVPYLGIYVSSAILIAAFMKYFGRYNWLMTLAVAILTPIAIFMMFEIWFLVPLPKGPVENWLGY